MVKRYAAAEDLAAGIMPVVGATVPDAEDDGFIDPASYTVRGGLLSDPLGTVYASGRTVFNAGSVDLMAEVCDGRGLGTHTPVKARVFPDVPKNQLLIIPTVKEESKRFDVRWSTDQREMTMQLRAAYVAQNVVLPSRGWVRELHISVYPHPDYKDTLAISLVGGNMRRIGTKRSPAGRGAAPGAAAAGTGAAPPAAQD